MCRLIHDIPIAADPSLSWEEIGDQVHEIIETWSWEGRKLGKIECIRDGDMIYIYAFAVPTITAIPAITISKGAATCNQYLG